MFFSGWGVWRITMVKYIWQCHKCELYWERDYPLAKNPDRTKCPECKKLCERRYTDTPVHFKGAGWTGINSITGFNKTGGSDEINKNLQEQCKERMKTGYQHYARYTPSKGYLEMTNARPLNDRELAERLALSKKVSAENYDKAGIDPYKKYKPQ
jgi:predicted nucleic acid-binding Zn ribbon protein